MRVSEGSFLINGIYASEYLNVHGVNRPVAPAPNWWASKERWPTVDPADISSYTPLAEGGINSAELLEIDFGRVRQINFVNFQVIRAPIDIFVSFDPVSDDLTRQWTLVRPMTDMRFDSRIGYDAQSKNAWFDAQFYFTDSKGNMVNTRYMRVKFKRRAISWPTRSANPFRWPIQVRNLRTARFVENLSDSIGVLFDTGTSNATQSALPLDPNAPPKTREVRQQFVVPADGSRGDIDPSLLGFGVLVQTLPDPAGDDAAPPVDIASLVSIDWSLYDITNGPTLLRNGLEKTVLNTGKTWVDVYWDTNPLDTQANDGRLYELRVRSADASVCSNVYVQSPNAIPATALPGTATFVHGSANVTTTQDLRNYLPIGSYIQLQAGTSVYKIAATTSNSLTLGGVFAEANILTTIRRIYPMTSFNPVSNTYEPVLTSSLAVRVWADVGDSGEDILGNTYRYATTREDAKKVFDSTSAGWVSAPQPTPEAVEALYFDVRDTASGFTKTTIDALKIAPRTPGVQMHIYYTQGALAGRAPITTEEWDLLLWKPVHATYLLRGEETFVLPTPIQASFVKLEFTALKPLPIDLPTYPKLPPVRYRRYPTWIENQFYNSDPRVRRTVEDWFIRNRTPVMVNILKQMTDPVLEFQYKEREFLAALALGRLDKRASQAFFIDPKTKTFIDPITATKITVNVKSMYYGTLKTQVDQTTLLGQVIADRWNPLLMGDPMEGQINTIAKTVPTVSTPNNRVSESFANLAQTPMWFNRECKHIYREEIAQFNKKAYFVGIREVEFLRADYTIARDDSMIFESLGDSDFLDENTFKKERDTSVGQQVYVSYTINDPEDIVDEPIILSAGGQPLAGVGTPAVNVRVFSQPGQMGDEFVLGRDIDIHYETDAETGTTVNVVRSTAPTARLVVSTAETNSDAAEVDGVAGISATDGYAPFLIETAVVVGVSSISATETVDLHSAATVTGTAAITYGEVYTMNDPGEVDGLAVITATDNHASDDSATVTGIMELSVNEQYVSGTGNEYADNAIVTGIGLAYYVEVLGRAVVSATDTLATQEITTVTGAAQITSVNGATTNDATMVSAIATISAAESRSTTEAATVTGIAVPTASDALSTAEAQTVTGIAVISALEGLNSYVDGSTVTAIGVPFAIDNFSGADAFTVIGIASITALETKTYGADSATVTGTAVVSAIDNFSGADAATVKGITVLSAIDSDTTSDAATVIGNATISAVEVHELPDAATIIAKAFVSALDLFTGDDRSAVTAIAQPSASDALSTQEQTTVTGVAVVSGVEQYSPFTGGNVWDDAFTIAGQAIVSAGDGFTGTDATMETLPTSGFALLGGNGTPGEVLTTASRHTNYPDANVLKLRVAWSTLQPNTYTDFVWPASLDTSIDDALTRGYKIALEVMAGQYTPVWTESSPGANNNFLSVNSMHVIDPDFVADITIPVPWDTNLATHYQNMLTSLQTQLAGNTNAGNRRADALTYIVPTLGMMSKPEMTITYGQAATYSGTAALSGSLTAGATTISMASGYSTFPVTRTLFKIDNELILGTRTGATIAVTARGFSGTVAASHAATAKVSYLSAGGFGSSGSPVTFNGVSGIYDIRVQNQKIWETLGSLATNQARLATLWTNVTNMHLATMSVPTMLVVGSLFEDEQQNALNIVQSILPSNLAKLYIMSPDFQCGLDNLLNPTNVYQGATEDTYYEGADPTLATVLNWVNSAQPAAITGIRCSRKTVWDAASNPYSGAASALRLAFGEAVNQWTLSYVEITTDIVDTNAGADSTYNYFFLG